MRRVISIMQVVFLLEGTERDERRAAVNWLSRLGSLACKVGAIDARAWPYVRVNTRYTDYPEIQKCTLLDKINRLGPLTESDSNRQIIRPLSYPPSILFSVFFRMISPTEGVAASFC